MHWEYVIYCLRSLDFSDEHNSSLGDPAAWISTTSMLGYREISQLQRSLFWVPQRHANCKQQLLESPAKCKDWYWDSPTRRQFNVSIYWVLTIRASVCHSVDRHFLYTRLHVNQVKLWGWLSPLKNRDAVDGVPHSGPPIWSEIET